ncbi:DUF2975 domain-containing protein [Terrisporobacter mayombei]|uniref:DUF2975 domain-containing protein n=1 Tax=Terrisporobacter mayombei TaxID=1541 RepID=A0ABY9Q0I9_9FIRM|nr:DUF2975 domain-containing protein [Terrisporobacter mayombei]MCC3866890.1 DUF2975 domain-containing protein [Terrisporobacter mayombei]WMT81134.1 hypothetical protein TEMA_14660 [Terrisporobacter mayombei]
MKNNYSKILNIIVSVGIILTLIMLAGLPFILGALSKSTSINIESKYITVMTAIIYICATPYVIALFNLKKLCSHITSKNPFSESIPKLINNIAYCSFSEVILFNLMNIIFYFIFNIYLYAFAILPCVIVSFLSIAIGVFALISSKLFEMIIDIKDENDRTI